MVSAVAQWTLENPLIEEAILEEEAGLGTVGGHGIQGISCTRLGTKLGLGKTLLLCIVHQVL